MEKDQVQIMIMKLMVIERQLKELNRERARGVIRDNLSFDSRASISQYGGITPAG